MSLDKSLSLVSATKPALVDRKLARRSRMTSRIQTQIEILEKVKAGVSCPLKVEPLSWFREGHEMTSQGRLGGIWEV